MTERDTEERTVDDGRGGGEMISADVRGGCESGIMLTSWARFGVSVKGGRVPRLDSLGTSVCLTLIGVQFVWSGDSAGVTNSVASTLSPAVRMPTSGRCRLGAMGLIAPRSPSLDCVFS